MVGFGWSTRFGGPRRGRHNLPKRRRLTLSLPFLSPCRFRVTKQGDEKKEEGSRAEKVPLSFLSFFPPPPPPCSGRELNRTFELGILSPTPFFAIQKKKKPPPFFPPLPSSPLNFAGAVIDGPSASHVLAPKGRAKKRRDWRCERD